MGTPVSSTNKTDCHNILEIRSVNDSEFLSRYVSRYFRQVTIRIVIFCIPLCVLPFFSLKDLPHMSMKIETNI
jgi:hypothetical protein